MKLPYDSIKKKTKILGINYSTASRRLTRKVLFRLAELTNMLNCFRCGGAITEETFSIDHKVDWMGSLTPVKTFFDLDQIAFSHISCNARHSSGSKKRIKTPPDGQGWCGLCTQMKPLPEFPPRKVHKPKERCRQCISRVKNIRYHEGKVP